MDPFRDRFNAYKPFTKKEGDFSNIGDDGLYFNSSGKDMIRLYHWGRFMGGDSQEFVDKLVTRICIQLMLRMNRYSRRIGEGTVMNHIGRIERFIEQRNKKERAKGIYLARRNRNTTPR